MRSLFWEDGTFYRANLHAHTTRSDGSLEPSELFASYRDAGYSILAMTDHEVAYDNTALTTPEFLVLRGFEMSFASAGRSTPTRSTCHITFIAKTPDVAQTPETPAFLPPEEGEKLGYVRTFSTDGINDVLCGASAAGYFPILSHPFWSLQKPEEFSRLDNLGGVEVYNHLCALAGSRDCSAEALEAFLAAGKCPLPVAADDCHGDLPAGDPACDRFGGFEMICARELTYEAVIEALEAGQAYASTGPLLSQLGCEDGRLLFVCSPAREVRLLSDTRPVDARLYDPAGQITYGSFAIPPAARWVRLEITDSEGKTAWTRAYHESEL